MSQTIELTVEGMTCGHCVRAVKEALESVSGVSSAEVTLEPGQATVHAEEGVSPDALIAAVTEEGYDARRS